jgi:hypothetical protein
MVTTKGVGLVERVGKVLLSPREQIRQSIHERRSPLEPILLGSLISGVNGALLAAAFIQLSLRLFLGFIPLFPPSLLSSVVSSGIVAGLAVAFVVSVLIAGLIVAAIMHFAAKILGGHGSYSESVMVVFYSILPYGFVALPLLLALVAPLPMLILAGGFTHVAFVWQVYMLFEGIKEVYGIDTSKTVLVLLAPLILAILLVALLSAWALLFSTFARGGFLI